MLLTFTMVSFSACKINYFKNQEINQVVQYTAH